MLITNPHKICGVMLNLGCNASTSETQNFKIWVLKKNNKWIIMAISMNKIEHSSNLIKKN
jgi:hypothetical protein